MKTFKIPVVYQASALYHIMAENLDQAENIALSRKIPMPINAQYIEDSMELDKESESYGETV